MTVIVHFSYSAWPAGCSIIGRMREESINRRCMARSGCLLPAGWRCACARTLGRQGSGAGLARLRRYAYEVREGVLLYGTYGTELEYTSRRPGRHNPAIRPASASLPVPEPPSLQDESTTTLCCIWRRHLQLHLPLTRNTPNL